MSQAVAGSTASPLFAEERPSLILDDGDPDQLEVSFSGTVPLDRTNPEHVFLLNSLRLGRSLDLSVSGVVTARPIRAKLDEDGNLEERVLRASIRITSLEPTT
jgi:hypothetical protein